MKFLKSLAVTKPVLYWAVAIGVVLIGGIFLFSRNGGGERETLIVKLGEFVQEVSVSGKVVATQEVDLAFSETGRISSIRVKVGDRVSRGELLASQASEILTSDLRAAEIELEEARKENDTLVQSAYRKLLSSNLSAVPDSSNYTASPPTVTGLYTGPEGVYKILVDRKKSGINKRELRTFGLERTDPVEILNNDPTVLGTFGLFISFPDSLDLYDDTVWYVTVPNTKNSSYLVNKNAYDEALRARDKAIANAESKVASIRTSIDQRVLRAPFAGVVTAVPGNVGGIAAANQIILSLISADTLQIESYVPEINLSLMRVGAKATVTLDAYGEGVSFEAAVISIDPAETVRDGVSTYRAVFEFLKRDERVLSGMTANIVVLADRREGVISVPQGVVESRDGKKFVRTLVGEEVVEREVTLGQVSSLGSVEILSGLSPGDIVILSG